MAAVKSLVVFMGVLILAGLGLLGYGMMQASEDLEAGKAEPVRQFGDLDLGQPAGSRLGEVIPDGAGHLMITVTGGDRPDRVVVLDMRDGTVLGTVSIGAADAPR
jgi:hypothetical protein